MRSIWKGSLVFGLVNVPVAVYSATEDKDIKFNQVHATDGGRIRYSRVCEACGEVVAFGDIAKQYEAPDGRTARITNDDMASLPVSQDREIDLLSFVPTEQIDPMLYESSYVLEPVGKSTKAYALLRTTLADTDRIAIVHFALRSKTRLAALRVKDNMLVLQTLRWPDELRQISFESLDKEIEVSPAERQMAALLVDSYADDFHPEQHEDRYRIELEQLLEAKLEDREAFPDKPVQEEDDAEVLDLLAALQRSVEKHKGGTAVAKEAAKLAKAAGAEELSEAPEKPKPKRASRAKKAE